MVAIGGARGSGKTKTLLKTIKSGDYVLCANVEHMKERLLSYNITGVTVLHYDDAGIIPEGSNIYIDEIESFIHNIFDDCNVKGFTVVI